MSCISLVVFALGLLGGDCLELLKLAIAMRLFVLVTRYLEKRVVRGPRRARQVAIRIMPGSMMVHVT